MSNGNVLIDKLYTGANENKGLKGNLYVGLLILSFIWVSLLALGYLAFKGRR
jgi:hypothetical protein